MSDTPDSTSPAPILRPDGCIQAGATVIQPWPSLRMHPKRDLASTNEIVWANPGDPLWPFAERIPLPLLQVAKIMSGSSWEVLEMVAASPERGAVMLVQAPALAVLVVKSLTPSQGDRFERLRHLLSLRWHEILGELGLPRERRLVRLFRKIPAFHAHPITVDSFADAIKTGHPHVRLLSHLPKITRDTVALLRLPPDKVNAHLLLASSGSDHDEEPVTWCVDTVAWFREQEKPGRPWPYARLDVKGLARVEELYRSRYGDGAEHLLPFPEPPVPGIPGRITALRDFFSVVAEGDEQANCAESYIPDIQQGLSYLYAVTVLEGATLALRRTAAGRWVVDDVKARFNRPASRETIEFIYAWLAEHYGNESGARKEDSL